MDPKFASGKDLFKCHSPLLKQKPNRDYLRVIFISHPETNTGTTSLHLPEFSEYATSRRLSPQQNSSSPLKVARLTFKNDYYGTCYDDDDDVMFSFKSNPSNHFGGVATSFYKQTLP